MSTHRHAVRQTCNQTRTDKKWLFDSIHLYYDNITFHPESVINPNLLVRLPLLLSDGVAFIHVTRIYL